MDWKHCAEAVITLRESGGPAVPKKARRTLDDVWKKTVGSVGGVGAKVVLVEAREEVVQLLAKVGGVWGHQRWLAQ